MVSLQNSDTLVILLLRARISTNNLTFTLKSQGCLYLREESTDCTVEWGIEQFKKKTCKYYTHVQESTKNELVFQIPKNPGTMKAMKTRASTTNIKRDG